MPFCLLQEGCDDVTTKNASLWHVMPLQPGSRYLWYTRTSRVDSLGWKLRQNASPQRWYMYTKQYDVKPQGTVTFFPWDFPTKLRYSFVRYIANYKSNLGWRGSCSITWHQACISLSCPLLQARGWTFCQGRNAGGSIVRDAVVAQLFSAALDRDSGAGPLPTRDASSRGPRASSAVSSLRPATA